MWLAFFLICVVVAGLYGAATVSKRIFFVQTLGVAPKLKSPAGMAHMPGNRTRHGLAGIIEIMAFGFARDGRTDGVFQG